MDLPLATFERDSLQSDAGFVMRFEDSNAAKRAENVRKPLSWSLPVSGGGGGGGDWG